MDVHFSEKMQHANIFWEVQNFLGLLEEEFHTIQSPEFVVHLGTPTKWAVIIHGKYTIDRDFVIDVSLKRLPDSSGPKLIHLKVLMTVNHPPTKVCWSSTHSTGFYVNDSMTVIHDVSFSKLKGKCSPFHEHFGTLYICFSLIHDVYIYTRESDIDADLKALSIDLKTFFKIGNFCDLDLSIVKSNKTFSGHRAIVKARSPYVALELQKEPLLRNINLPDKSFIHRQIENLISYWYSGDLQHIVNTFSSDMRLTLLKMQEKGLLRYTDTEDVMVSTKFEATDSFLPWCIENYERRYHIRSPIFYDDLNNAWRLDFFCRGIEEDTECMVFLINQMEGNVYRHPVYINLYLETEDCKRLGSQSGTIYTGTIEKHGQRTFRRFITFENFFNFRRNLQQNDRLRVVLRLKYATGKVTSGVSNFPKAEICILNKGNSFINLANDLKELYESGDMYDALLITSRKTFKAHIPILAARSRYFDDIFRNRFYDVQKPIAINIEDIEPEELDQVLRYIYYAKPIDLNSSSLHQVYSFAKKYRISRLENTI